jgi:FkbM family methyltransferase
VVGHDGAQLLRDLAPRLPGPLVVVDVGARWGASDRWAPLGDAVEVIGFEPDAAEADRLNALGSPARYVPVALGADDGPAILHRTADPACASLYPPLAALPMTRPELHVVAEIDQQVIQVAKLDTWLGKEHPAPVHVLKLDTQGSELDVLRGAEGALQHIRLLEIEVEFNPIYDGQPLFGDVDRFLRARGFTLWRVSDLAHYGLADAGSLDTQTRERSFYDSRPVHSAGQGGQLFWAHAYYVAANMVEPKPDDHNDPMVDACAAAAYGFTDLAASVLARARTAGTA